MPRFLPAAFVAALVFLMPAAASATTTATRVGNAITITGDDGPNVISVNNVGNFIMYEDTSGPNIVAGDGCFQENPSLINCGQGGSGLIATITLGGGDDTYDDRLARTDWPVADLDAGDGNDTINGSYGSDILRGGPGNDTLRGIAANDQIDGGPGDDTIHGGADDDLVIGGPGRDSINGDGDYSGTTLGGNDTIQARDGETDQVACGFGADTAVLDASDVGLGGRLRERRPAGRRWRWRGHWRWWWWWRWRRRWRVHGADGRAVEAQARPLERAGARQGLRRPRDDLAALRGHAEANRQPGGGAAGQARAQGGHARLDRQGRIDRHAARVAEDQEGIQVEVAAPQEAEGDARNYLQGSLGRDH
jgi:hypothetical protein